MRNDCAHRYECDWGDERECFQYNSVDKYDDYRPGKCDDYRPEGCVRLKDESPLIWCGMEEDWNSEGTPVWHCKECGEVYLAATNMSPNGQRSIKCPVCGGWQNKSGMLWCPPGAVWIKDEKNSGTAV